MIVLFDIDSLLYSSCYNVSEFEEAVFKFQEIYHWTINQIEEEYEIEQVIPLGLCRGNYRYKIDPSYKANRKVELPDYYNELCQYIYKDMDVVSTVGCETDDLVVAYHKRLGKDNAIICSIDKDYLQVEGIIYNYLKKEFIHVSPEQALQNFYFQMVVGDSADNVNYCKGYGKRWCEKNLIHNTEFGYQRSVLKLFKQLYGNKGREKFLKCYYLLKLNAI
jgi:5'-3' exonuclease